MTSTASCKPGKCTSPLYLGRGRRITKQYAPPANPATPTATATVFCHQDAIVCSPFVYVSTRAIPARSYSLERLPYVNARLYTSIAILREQPQEWWRPGEVSHSCIVPLLFDDSSC